MIFIIINKFYAIKNLDEARAYLNDEYLANNIINICNELLKLKTNNPDEIFGEIDSMKIKSSMILSILNSTQFRLIDFIAHL